jgi:hypothetical protein
MHLFNKYYGICLIRILIYDSLMNIITDKTFGGLPCCDAACFAHHHFGSPNTVRSESHYAVTKVVGIQLNES